MSQKSDALGNPPESQRQRPLVSVATGVRRPAADETVARVAGVVGIEVGFVLVRASPISVGPGTPRAPRIVANGPDSGPGARFLEFRLRGSHAGGATGGVSHGSSLSALRRARRPQGDGGGLRPAGRAAARSSGRCGPSAPRPRSCCALADWLAAHGCTHVAMEATGVYWKPVWHVLADGDFELVLANAAHVKNVPGRKTDVNDATWLADLLAHGLIRASFVPDAADAGAARADAHPQAARARAGQPRPAASRRRWRTPTSSSPRCSPTSWA